MVRYTIYVVLITAFNIHKLRKIVLEAGNDLRLRVGDLDSSVLLLVLCRAAVLLAEALGRKHGQDLVCNR